MSPSIAGTTPLVTQAGRGREDGAMLPVVTPSEMAGIDAAAPEPVEVLIERAGSAVARAALDLLGGTYGRRVVVLAGKGNNGNDGRSAAVRLRRRGVRVEVLDAATAPDQLPRADLVIDAAYGTGFRGTYAPPDPGLAAVLAVDIPSGVDGLTGAASGSPMQADATVTFAALKPGLLFGDGRRLAGDVELVDIGLDVSGSSCGVIEAGDVASLVPRRTAGDHKWREACVVLAGSPGMGGAAHLAAASAQRGGAGMVQVLTPGAAQPEPMPVEAVAIDGRGDDWIADAIAGAERAHAAVIGPGLPPDRLDPPGLARLISGLGVPVVVDGGALGAVRPGGDLDASAGVVLTPHDGEFTRLTGRAPDADRIGAARHAADQTGCVVLLKGPTTVIADPAGRTTVMVDGDQRLATAGSGDVLAGLIGAFLARGADPFDAAGAAAEVHALAADATAPSGLVASDLVEALPLVRAALGT